MIRRLLTTLVGLYLGWGLTGGLIMSWAIPAMSWQGVLYYALTWPAYFTGAGELLLPPWLAGHLFTFN